MWTKSSSSKPEKSLRKVRPKHWPKLPDTSLAWSNKVLEPVTDRGGDQSPFTCAQWAARLRWSCPMNQNIAQHLGEPSPLRENLHSGATNDMLKSRSTRTSLSSFLRTMNIRIAAVFIAGMFASGLFAAETSSNSVVVVR